MFVSEGLWQYSLFGDPNGTRTRVSGVRGQRPRPLDDGTIKKVNCQLNKMAGERGFEPLKAEPESAVIPLHHSPKYKALNQQVVYINCPIWSIWTKGVAHRALGQRNKDKEVRSRFTFILTFDLLSLICSLESLPLPSADRCRPASPRRAGRLDSLTLEPVLLY